jgi:hypothetical protein
VSQQERWATRRTTAPPPTQTQDETEEDEYDDVWPTRLPTSSRRYIQVPTQQAATMQGPRKRVVNVYDLPPNIPPRRSRITTEGYAAPALPPGQPAQRATSVQQSRRTHLHIHWMFLVGVGMIATLALWVLGNLAVNWWSVTQDDWHYGHPRTFQIDAVVGHNDDPTTPSHFLAINLNRHVEVIEFPGGDATHAKIYIGPTLFGDGQQLTPVTLSFKDVNGDGKPDMIVHIQDQTVVFINDGTQFRPLKPGEHITL